jgi:hypothetical protein
VDLYGYCLNDPVNWVDPRGLDWVDVNRMISEISRSHEMNSPESVKYSSGLNPAEIAGRADRWNNQLILPNEQFSKQLTKQEFESLYQTVYHEMRHLNAPEYQEAIDFWHELFTGEIGPYHEKIYKDELSVYPPENLFEGNSPCE